MREYIYLPEAEISPTFGSRTVVDRPLAVVNAVNTASPALWHKPAPAKAGVHTDHLNRPIRMTDAAQAVVWNAQWLPWGNVFAITGTANLDARFPGQWFQLESGLHYNWYRHYDPTIGRFTQPDPLGFVDGPSRYAYGRSSPIRFTDFDGRFANPGSSWLPVQSKTCTETDPTGNGRDSDATTNVACGPGDDACKLPGKAPRGDGGGGSLPQAPSGVAKQISEGHAFEKHVLDQDEFKGAQIRTRQQFENLIQDVLNNPTIVRELSGGRTGYWQQSTGTVVITNPKSIDGGTAFQPRDGFKYFEGLR